MSMREETAYNILKGYGADPAQAQAISKIFSVSHNDPQEKQRLIEGMEKSGIPHNAAITIVDLFLSRRPIQ